MSRAVVELDFLGTEKQSCAKSLFGQTLIQKNNVKGLQRAMSKIDPLVLRAVFAGGSLAEGSVNKSVSPKTDGVNQQVSAAAAIPLTLSSHTSRPASEKANEATPLTIFYNGAVAVFNVSEDKAKGILKLAEKEKREGLEAAGQSFQVASDKGDQLLEDLAQQDLPIARKHSLVRFLEKRRDRMIALSPYASHPSDGTAKLT